MDIEVVNYIYYCFVKIDPVSSTNLIWVLEHMDIKFPPYDYSACNFYQKSAELVRLNLWHDKSIYVGHLSQEFSALFDPVQKSCVIERCSLAPETGGSDYLIREVSHAHPGVTIPSSAWSLEPDFDFYLRKLEVVDWDAYRRLYPEF